MVISLRMPGSADSIRNGMMVTNKGRQVCYWVLQVMAMGVRYDRPHADAPATPLAAGSQWKLVSGGGDEPAFYVTLSGWRTVGRGYRSRIG